MKSRIMYIEGKSASLDGPARIGRVTFSKTGLTIRYKGKEFQRTTFPLKANYFDVATGDDYWISGPRRDGRDRLYGDLIRSEEIDADVWDEYWKSIRKKTPPRRC